MIKFKKYENIKKNVNILMDTKTISENNTSCNICYELSETIVLQCCNSTKHICNNCLECLTKPICPWCRQDLPEKLIKEKMISSSCIDDYNNYLEIETDYLLINPYDPEFYDSRILRRTMRNIRNRFNRITMQRRAIERRNRNNRHTQLSISIPITNNSQTQNIYNSMSHSIPIPSSIPTSLSNGSLSSISSEESNSSDEYFFETSRQNNRNNKKSKRAKKKENKNKRHGIKRLTREITQHVNNDDIDINENILNGDDITDELFSFEF